MKKGKIIGYKKPTYLLSNRMRGLDAIYTNGKNNLYPYYVSNSVDGSPIGARAHNLNSDFIAGNLDNDFVINAKDEVYLSSLILDCAKDISKFGGFFVHISYGLSEDGSYVKKTFKHIPFENCRISKKDGDDWWSFVYVDDFFTDRNIRKLNKKKYFYRYNDDKSAIFSQIKRDAELNKIDVNKEDWIVDAMRSYRGQIAFFKMSSEFPYPVSPLDSILMDCNVDFFTSKYNIEQSSNGFMGKTVVFTRNNPGSEEQFYDFENFLGAEESSGVYVQPLDIGQNPDDVLKIVSFEAQFDDKLQRATHVRNKENIYGGFDNIPWLLVESGTGALFGSNPETFLNAKRFYSEQTEKKRTFLNKSLKRLIEKDFKLSGYDR